MKTPEKMKKVLVIGAARSGVAVTQTLIHQGCEVILTDTQDPDSIVKSFPMVREALQALSGDRLEKVFGRQIDPERVDSVDLVLTSPGVPLTVPVIQAAYAKGIPVWSEVELAYHCTDTPFVAITGTNGKTTTTTLTGEIFRHSGRGTFTVGNIGDPISNYVEKAERSDVFVTEISSFQLQTCKDFHPVCAAILNLSPDHLDRHKTVENYYETKARIFMNHNENDVLVLNADDPNVRKVSENAKGQKIWFSLESEPERGAFVRDGMVYLRDGSELCLMPVAEIGIKGPHNLKNAMAAACLAYFYPGQGVPLQVIRETLKAFKGVEHRQERFAVIDGVTYINDSKGTNTDAAITALKAMTGPVILIAGGYDKHEVYTDFILEARKQVKQMILIGVTAPAIAACARENGFSNFVFADDFEQAVMMAMDQAVPGDTVLLSPACASWDMFDNYEIRGRLFKSLVLNRGDSK